MSVNATSSVCAACVRSIKLCLYYLTLERGEKQSHKRPVKGRLIVLTSPLSFLLKLLIEYIEYLQPFSLPLSSRNKKRWSTMTTIDSRHTGVCTFGVWARSATRLMVQLSCKRKERDKKCTLSARVCSSSSLDHRLQIKQPSDQISV